MRKKGAIEVFKNIKNPRNQGKNKDLLPFYGLIYYKIPRKIGVNKVKKGEFIYETKSGSHGAGYFNRGRT